MSESDNMLHEMASRLFEKIDEERHSNSNTCNATLPLSQWQLIEEFYLPSLLIPEEKNGFGGNWQDAGVIFQLLGYYAIGLPVGETIIANKLIHDAGFALPSGPVSIVDSDPSHLMVTANSSELRISGQLLSVPWGSQVKNVLVSGQYNNEAFLALFNIEDSINVHSNQNAAGESRDDIHFENAAAVHYWIPEENAISLFNAGALLRTAQISGALTSALEQSIKHVNERSQFGRPIAKFQAIQHDLAQLAEQCSSVSCAYQTACNAANVDDAAFEITAARLTANYAIPLSTTIAHQVHGAIGFTKEHLLHQATQRLFSWHKEFGNDRMLANTLGRLAIESSEGNLWAFLTARSDAVLKKPA